MSDQTPQSEESSQRLSFISTMWTQFRDAHATDQHGEIRRTLLMKYRGAARRYLLGATSDPEVADELFHEFTVRFLQGDFHRASPERGRFRDYVRTVLINLVNDHHRQRQKAPAQVIEEFADVAGAANTSVSDFETCIRDELMDRTWQMLEKANATYHAVLRVRVTQQDMTSRELSQQLAESGHNLTAATVRKTVERARKKFAQLFLDQVLDMLEFESPEELRAELTRLNLLIYCESELTERGFTP